MSATKCRRNRNSTEHVRFVFVTIIMDECWDLSCTRNRFRRIIIAYCLVLLRPMRWASHSTKKTTELLESMLDLFEVKVAVQSNWYTNKIALILFLFRFFYQCLFFRFFFVQVCNYCKKKGAHIGCCKDIGTDLMLKFCPKKYHVDCGMHAGAMFSVSKNRGTVSLCFDHRDSIER